MVERPAPSLGVSWSGQGKAASAPCAVHKHGAVGHSNDDMVVPSGGSAASHLAGAGRHLLGLGSERGGQTL